MATAQTSQSKAAKKSPASRNNRQSDTEELSGERDEHYNLISVLYHGLQGADQCALYADDAEDAGDDDLAEFLRSAGQTQGELAKQAKQLLLERLSTSAGPRSPAKRSAGSEDEDDLEEDDD